MKVLFLCRGNVGRSQIAEILFVAMTKGKHATQSAGVKLSGPEEPVKNLLPETQYLIECMKEKGFDVSERVRNQLTPEMAANADKIIAVMDEHDPSIPEYVLRSGKLVQWNIADLKGKSLEEHRAGRDRIERLLGDFIRGNNL